MINPTGYQAYNNSQRYATTKQYGQSMSGTSGKSDLGQSVNNQDAMPTLNQKVIPGSEQEALLVERFGEKKLKMLGVMTCETCDSRKYQDGSDDPGVSFKTPQHISPETSAATVMGHEQEHVVREQAKATQEDREVVSQSVTLHGSVCPECGRSYIAGGKTRTVTKEKDTQEAELYKGNLVDMRL